MLRDQSARSQMRSAPRWRRLVGALVVLAGVWAGDAQGSGYAGGALEGGESEQARVIVAFDTEPTTLDYQLRGDEAKELATFSINEALMEVNADGSFRPVLAATVPELDPDDPTRWRVELREGIEFTNGEPFNAEAVAANIERVIHPDFGSTVSGYDALAGAEVIDEYTVDLLTVEPDYALPYKLNALRMVPPAAAQEPGYEESPVGTGPYMFEEWERGDHLTLVRNPDYWGEQGTVEEVVIRFIPDGATRLSALRAGEVDIVAHLAPDQADQAPATLVSPASESLNVRLNLTVPPYDDERFRRALNLAIDREGINEALFSGQYGISNCQQSVEGIFGYNPDLEPFPYDPDEAVQLVEEVGLPDDFTVEFVAPSNFFARDQELAQAIAAGWEAIGLRVNLTFLPEDQWIDAVFQGGENVASAPDAFLWGIDHRWATGVRIIDRLYVRDSESSTIGDAHPELDDLIQTAFSDPDDAARDQAYQDVWALACEQSLSLSLLDVVDIWGVSEAIDYTPGRGQLTQFRFETLRLNE